MPLHYAVLASLSTGYSPPEGRLPTRYSPGRHSTQSRSPFRVRLACVRHAASVDSEPGSNSQSIILGNRSDSRTTLILRSLKPASSQGLDVFSLCLIFKDRLRSLESELLFEDLPREQAKGDYTQETCSVNGFFQLIRFIFAHACVSSPGSLSRMPPYLRFHFADFAATVLPESGLIFTMPVFKASAFD